MPILSRWIPSVCLLRWTAGHARFALLVWLFLGFAACEPIDTEDEIRGDAVASASDQEGESPDVSDACPASAPSVGATCAHEGLACEWSDPCLSYNDGQCPLPLRCEDGHWRIRGPLCAYALPCPREPPPDGGWVSACGWHMGSCRYPCSWDSPVDETGQRVSILAHQVDEHWHHEISVCEDCATSLGAPTAPAVAAGAWSYCTLASDGVAACTGGPEPAPPCSLASIRVGTHLACGLDEDGDALCWSGGDSFRRDGPYIDLSVGDGFACALEAEGRPVCWHSDGRVGDAPRQVPLAGLAVGDTHVCGWQATRGVLCWPVDQSAFVTTEAPDTPVTALALGSRHACALDPAGAITCWFLVPRDPDDASIITPPTGTFVALAASEEHTCALDAEGRIACWGDGWAERGVPATNEPFVSVATGKAFSCGLTAGEELRCVGSLPGPHDDGPAE